MAATTGARYDERCKWNGDHEVYIHDALLYSYDLKSPKSTIWHYFRNRLTKLACDLSDTTTISKIQKLDSLLHDGFNPDSNRILNSYVEHHDIYDILQDFMVVSRNGRGLNDDGLIEDLNPLLLLNHLRLIVPRLYSISSSPFEAQKGFNRSNRSTEAQLTVAVVKYIDTVSGKRRRGLASTFLSDIVSIGDILGVFLERNEDFKLPHQQSSEDVNDLNNTTPLLFIGPGTGIAPFRAMIMQESKLGVNAVSNYNAKPMHLYFGCRHKDKDFLYRELLLKWEEDGLIRLRTAFSRDQVSYLYHSNMQTPMSSPSCNSIFI